MKAVISEKGQVTIPKPLRERLGLRAGETLDFDDEGGRLVAVKVSEQEPVNAVYGILDLEQSSDAFIAELRGDPAS